ncbi:MAG: hypothetical protein N4A46_07135 [Schleiferiaceae bacterium]|nr:hypothetical protein [Schleiferiaceae bacterium]
MNYGLIGRIVMWALMLISVILFVTAVNSSATDGFVAYGMYLTYAAVALAVLGSVFSLIIDPSNLKSVALGLVAFIVVLGVAYGISDGSDYEMYAKYDVTESTSRMVSMGINTFIVLSILAVVSILYSAISSVLK